MSSNQVNIYNDNNNSFSYKNNTKNDRVYCSYNTYLSIKKNRYNNIRRIHLGEENYINSDASIINAENENKKKKMMKQ